MSLTFSRFILVCLFLFSSSSLLAKYDPDLAWYTQETPHFIFHYHDGLEHTVEDFTIHAEQIHRNISAFFDWQPKQKTHVILNDHFDSANGSARLFPENVIEMNLTPPSNITGLEDFKNWKYLLFEHEYVHIVHLDMAGDFPLDLRSILGRHWLLFPSQYVPRWLIEGLATYMETDNEQQTGRGQSTYYRALMRNEVKKGILSLNQVNQTQLDWPGGTTRYLYGVYFFTFLEKKYSKPLIQEFTKAYSKFPVPYFISTVSRRVFGKTLHQLWGEFNDYLHEEFDDELSKTDNNKAHVQQLSQSGFRSGFSKLLPNGDVIFIENDKENIKSLSKYKPFDNSYNTLFKSIAIGDSFDIHPEKGILIPLVDWVNSARLVTDLYIIDIETGHKTRLTQKQRYIRAVWHPDGKKIVAVKNGAGLHQLDLLDSAGNLLDTLWENEKDVVIGDMDFSPSGEHLIASVFRPNSGWNLEEFKLSTRQWAALTHNQFIESHPRYTHNGKNIIYTAEYSGTYNIFMLSLDDKRLHQLTDIDTAALYPTLNEQNNMLYYSALSNNGFNLQSQRFKKQKSRDKFLLTQNLDIEQISETKNIATTSQTTDYNGLKYLTPKWWAPFFLLNEEQTTLGFVTTSNDPIQRHNYSFIYAYDLQNASPLWNINYFYTRLMPTIGLNTNKNIFYPNKNISREERSASFVISWPLNKINNNRKLFAAVKRTNSQWFSRSDQNESSPKIKNDLFAIGFVRSSTSQPTLAVNQHSGTNIELSYELNSFSKSIKSQSRVILNAALYSPVIFKTVVEFGTTLIRSGDSAGLLYLDGDRNELFNSGIAGRTTYSLSGYKHAGLSGTNLQKVYLNLHIPLTYPQRSIMSPPIGISRIKFRPFFQSARIGSYRTVNQQSWRSSVGAEFEVQANFGYGLFPFAIKAGLANGLNEGGEFTTYIVFLSRFI